MVRFKNLVWSPETNRRRVASNEKNETSKLGILAFETAKIMSRLVSLYKSLSDEGISTLKNDVVRSRGVQFLNSVDEDFLLGLACAEKLEDLDRAANAVSWLGKRCDDFGLNRFVSTYTNLKLGIYDLGKLEPYGSRASEKKVRRMEKLVSLTSRLHAALDSLTEMEISERKLKQLSYRQIETMKINIDEFIDKLENQRKEVRRFREISLWSKTFDKSVDLMARILCVVYLRICSVFGPQTHGNLVAHSGPLLTQSNPAMVRFHSQRSIHFPEEDEGTTKIAKSNNTLFNSAAPETVGGSGLVMRYANLIILAEKYLDLDSNVAVSHEDRESFYQMVPENVRSVLRTKLSKKGKCSEKDAWLAEGWRDAMTEMMGWLAPMAHDSVNWQMERNMERMRIDANPNSVLLLQTLHFSDKEKTEAAIAEVLVGLSCIFRFENRQLCV